MKIGRRAGYILGVLAIANLLSYANRNPLPPLYHDLTNRFGFSPAELGFLGSAYMFCHAAAGLPMGWFGDRRDRRLVIAAGLALAAIANGLTVFGDDLATLSLGRALAGLGTAAVIPIANSIIGELFAGPRKATAMAIFNLGIFLGSATGFLFAVNLGFPLAFVAIAVPSALIAFLIARLDIAPRRSGDAPIPSAGWRDAWRAGGEILRIPTLRWLMGSTTFMAFAAGGYASWLLAFLEDEKHMAKGEAAALLLAAGVAGLFGVLAGGRVADAFRRRVPHGRLWAITLGMGLTVPMSLACIYAPAGIWLWIAGVTTVFFASWYHAPVAASVDDLAPPDRAATTQSLVVSLMHLLGTAPSSLILGMVAKRAGLTEAMLVSTACVGVAALMSTRAYATFARDSAASGGGGAGSSL